MVPLSATTAWAVAFGCVFGLGLWCVAACMPRLSRPLLAGRIAPYLVDVSDEARRIRSRAPADPVPVLGVLAAPALRLFELLFGSVLGIAGRTASRLRQAGDRRSVESYRMRQMLWTVGGGGVGSLLGVVLGATRGGVGTGVAASLVGAGAGLVACDRLLARRAALRAARLEAELPTVLEFLALSLAAGEGVHDAIRRVARGSGELSAEFRAVVAEVRVGVSLSTALTRLGDELAIPSITRCLTHIVGALDRGSPLAELLRAQAADAREEARRAMLEAAGKKEIAMLVPLVFLILPVTIAFAVFPGLVVLQTQL